MVRTYGLSGSGMDVDQMVKDIMKAKRVQYDTLTQKKTQLEWKKTDYNTMYSSINDFRNSVFDTKLQSNLSPRKTSSTNTSAVTATSSAEASNMTHTIEVGKLANGVQEVSSDKISIGSKETLMSQFGMAAGNFNLQITNGNTSATVSIDTSQSVYDVVNNINKAGVGVVANYDANSDRFFLATASSGSNVGIDFAGSSALGLDFVSNKLKLVAPPTVSGTSTSTANVDMSLAALVPGFTGGNLKMTNGINSTTIALTKGDSVASLINKINGATGLNAVASIDATGKFNIKTTSGILDLSGSDASALSVLTTGLKLPNGSNELKTIAMLGVTGTDVLPKVDKDAKISDVFTSIAGKGTMKVSINGGAAKDLEIDFSKATITSIKDSLNALDPKIEAVYDTITRKFSIKGKNGENIDLSGSDKIVKNFLTDNLKMGNSTTFGGFTSSASSEALFADPLNTSLASQFGLVAGGTFNFRLTNGTAVNTITLDTSTDTLQTFMDKIGKAGVNATTLYNYTTRQFNIATTSGTLDFTGSDSAAMAFLTSKLKLTNVNTIDKDGTKSNLAMFPSESEKNVTSQFAGINGGRFSLVINNEVITMDTDTESLEKLVLKINTAIPAIPETASYSDGKFSLTGNLDFKGSDPVALEFLTNKLKINSSLAKKGNDAEITLDGVAMQQNSNVFTVSGVTYTLNGLTDAGKSASVVITSDIDKTVENVKKFVESYNTMLKKINDELNEAKYKDYLPLTDEAKKALSADQVKVYEEKAKSGILRRDPILSDLVTKMRNNFNDAVIGISGSKTTATSLGIDTGLGTYKEGGKLYLDETKLKNALNADPDAVYKVFGTDGVLLTGNQKGVAGRLYDSLKGTMDRISREGGLTASADYDTKSNLGKEIKDYKTRMTDMTRRLNDMESRYYKQFDAMEKALAKMQKQSSWFSSASS